MELAVTYVADQNQLALKDMATTHLYLQVCTKQQHK